MRASEFGAIVAARQVREWPEMAKTTRLFGSRNGASALGKSRSRESERAFFIVQICQDTGQTGWTYRMTEVRL